MKLIPLSITAYRTFRICPWKAHACQNLGFDPGFNSNDETDLELRHLLLQALRGRLGPEDLRRTGASEKAVNAVARVLTEDPVPRDATQLFQQYAAIDEFGSLLSTDPENIPEKAIAHGYVDRIIPDNGNELTVVAWQTDDHRADDPFECHLIAGLLTRALFPHARRIRFVKHHLSTGDRLTRVYTFDEADTSVSIQGPRGRPRIMHDEDGPLTAFLRAILRRIEATPAEPSPGEHCYNHDGSPCRFLGAECPLSEPLPALVDRCGPRVGPALGTETLRSIATDPDFEIRSEHASWAWNSVLQLEHFIGLVKKRLKVWAKDNGPIPVGDDRYGWSAKTENVVDAAYALRFMLDTNLPLEAICKAVNISRTSIERLPKEFHHVKRALLATAVTTRQGKPRFGLIQQ